MVCFKDNICEAKDRLDLWWKNEKADRPLIQVFSPRDQPVFQISAPEPVNIHDYWTNPEIVIPRMINKMGSTYYGAEAFPVLFPVSENIVSIINKYLGAPNVYVDRYTTWSNPVISSWSDCPSLDFNPQNEWWIITEQLMNYCSSIIKQYDLECYIGIPDLNGPTEVLSGLRNPEKLCMDLVFDPESVKGAIRKILDVWFRCWKETTRISQEFGGFFTWMGLWSNSPAVDLQSDFSCLISTEMFEEFIMPSLKVQMDAFPRTIFHLDGPGMIRHLDQLLELPELNAIQWIQGAGAGNVSDWMDLLHKIQHADKALYIYCKPEEVEYLVEQLDSKGLMLVVPGCESETKARELIQLIE